MNREHRAMRACACSESDKLYCVCLYCGKVNLPDPAWLVVAAGFVLLVAHAAWWILL